MDNIGRVFIGNSRVTFFSAEEVLELKGLQKASVFTWSRYQNTFWTVAFHAFRALIWYIIRLSLKKRNFWTDIATLFPPRQSSILNHWFVAQTPCFIVRFDTFWLWFSELEGKIPLVYPDPPVPCFINNSSHLVSIYNIFYHPSPDF